MKAYPSIRSIIGMLLYGTLFCFWGWYNGYPFVYPDTGTYVDSGFAGYIPTDRPITYGLFCRHTSLAESLMWVMVAQGVLCAVLVYAWLKHLLPRAIDPVVLLAAILFLISCTNASIYASYLLPDFLTPVFYGILILLLLTPMKPWPRALLSLLAVFAAMTHTSHLLGGLILVGVVGVYQVVSVREKRFSWKRLGLVSGIVTGGWLGLYTLSFSIGKKWEIMSDSHAFTMGRLHEIGLVRQYLDAKCPTTDLYLCANKEALPDDLLWDPNSPINQNGGRPAHKQENQFIIKDILTTPRFLKRYAIESLNGTLKQFFYFRAEKMPPQLEGTPPYNIVKAYFTNELIPYKIAHQNHRTWYLDIIEGTNTRQQYLFFVCLLVMVVLWYNQSWRAAIPEILQKAYYLLFVCLLINAFVCATFSTVVSRYQGRLVWLYILTGMMILFVRYRNTTWIGIKNLNNPSP